MGSLIRALMLGDVVGETGLRALTRGLPILKKKYKPDIIIANGENASEGFGVSVHDAEQLYASGVSVITTGNHVWQKRDTLSTIQDGTLLRPINYPDAAPGLGSVILEIGDTKVAVLNAQGRVRLSNIDCPFGALTAAIDSFEPDVRVVCVDFHAEDTEEKEAIGHYLAGRVSVVACTHTHVQSADERIINDQTAYISDLGMTGAIDSVLGFNTDIALERMVTQLPHKMQVSDARSAIRGIYVEIDGDTGHAISIDRIDYIPEL